MKKLLAYILCLSLLFAPFPAVAFDQMAGAPQPVVYSATVTGLRISAVNGGGTESGGSFIDNAGAAVVAFADGNHQIEIYSANGAMLKGVLKAAGSAETLATTGGPLNDGNLVTNGIFDHDDHWTKGVGWTIADGLLKASLASNTQTYQELTAAFTLTALYKTSVTLSSYSAGSPTIYTGNGAVIIPSPGNGTFSLYATKTGTTTDYAGLQGGVGANLVCNFDDFTMKKVLAPSTAGCTIVSLKAGTVWNFSYKSPSFTYGEATNFVIIRKLR